MWLCLFIFKRFCWQISMSTWSLTNLNTQSPSISNLSAHVDLFLLVRVYVSSPSLPGLSSNMFQWSADLFSAVHGGHIAFILCICKAGLLPMLHSVDEAPDVWHVWSSSLPCVPELEGEIHKLWLWELLFIKSCTSNSPTPSYADAYGICVCSHTQNCSFLVISSLFCQAREPPGTWTSRLDREALNMCDSRGLKGLSQSRFEALRSSGAKAGGNACGANLQTSAHSWPCSANLVWVYLRLLKIWSSQHVLSVF